MQVSDSPSRRLGLHHIAFFRSHLEGLDLATLGQRYLETGADLPKAKATLRWVRDQLIAAARKEKPALVKLLGIPLGRLDELEADGRSRGRSDSPAKQAPSLAEFQETYDPEGFFDEEELIKRFQEMYPVTDPAVARRIRRNARLRQRMREAILWLAPRVAAPPKAGDAVLAWFDEALAQRVHAQGFETDRLRDHRRQLRRRRKSRPALRARVKSQDSKTAGSRRRDRRRNILMKTSWVTSSTPSGWRMMERTKPATRRV